MSTFLSLLWSKITQVTSSKGRLEHSTSIDISALGIFPLWSQQPFRCRTFKALQWAHLSLQHFALWLSQSMSRFGSIPIENLFRTFICTPYSSDNVDNRLVIIPTSTVDLPACQILTDPDFYKSPIVLESEPDQEFLSFQLELNPFEMIYQSPWDLSQVLSPLPASPPAVLLSGFASRCSIVQKGAFPQSQINRGLQQLRDLYLRAGFKSEDLDKVLRRVGKQRR